MIAVAVNFFIVVAYTWFKYGFVLSASVKLYALLQIPVGIATVVSGYLLQGVVYWAAGITLGLLSLVLSLCIIYSKTDLWNTLVHKFTGIVKK
mgnify:FL=1